MAFLYDGESMKKILEQEEYVFWGSYILLEKLFLVLKPWFSMCHIVWWLRPNSMDNFRMMVYGKQGESNKTLEISLTLFECKFQFLGFGVGPLWCISLSVSHTRSIVFQWWMYSVPSYPILFNYQPCCAQIDLYDVWYYYVLKERTQ